MTPFFRRIRQKLANENQFLKYSRYAIGEIVLVVVGILIALSINNYNEQKKSESETKRLMANVRKEFQFLWILTQFFVSLSLFFFNFYAFNQKPYTNYYFKKSTRSPKNDLVY